MNPLPQATAVQLDTPTGLIGGWRAEPAAGTGRRGVLLVVQEIFGVNGHIRSVVETFAAHGFVAVAPAFFDHVAPGTELGYDEAGIAHGRELVQQVGFDTVIADCAAISSALAVDGHVGAVGFCWGGSVAYLCNTRLGLPAVSYYGGRTMPFLGEPLRAPMLFHFGENDPLIPPEHVAAHRAAHPQAEMHLYPAGHGFNCDQRADFDRPSAELALRRTVDFFDRTLR